MTKKKTLNYSPLNESEWEVAQQYADTITDRIGENQMNNVWALHNRINGTNERQPCGCASAAKHWIRAMESIRGFVKNVRGE
jgi:hypothetical protein